MNFQTIFLQASGITAFLPFILMFVVIYFFMIRPQMKRQKQEKAFQSSISRGSKVVTASGMHGKIVDIVENENTVIIEVKAVEIVNPVWQAQIISQLKLTDIQLGFLINFNVPLIKNGIKRFINTRSNY